MHRKSTFHAVDLRIDPRRAHFEYFSNLAYPYVGLTVEVDFTSLAEFRRRTDAPFFLTLLYCVSRAANAVPEFRRRIRNGQILEYDFCPSSHTEVRPDGTYGYCTLWADAPLSEFLSAARRAQESCRAEHGLTEADDPLACLFVSSLPWLSYTALVQPVPCPADSNPRISWGRAFRRDGRALLPLSVLCHHALVDGLHLSHFYQALDEELSALETMP